MLAVIMAGGSDTSLWPLSRELFPKQPGTRWQERLDDSASLRPRTGSTAPRRLTMASYLRDVLHPMPASIASGPQRFCAISIGLPQGVHAGCASLLDAIGHGGRRQRDGGWRPTLRQDGLFPQRSHPCRGIRRATRTASQDRLEASATSA